MAKNDEDRYVVKHEGAYSRYAPLHALLIGMLQPVRGDHRKYFVATAIARVCMQAPILHVMEAGFPAAPTPSMLRLVDRPDARFAWLRRHGLGVIPGAVAEADRVLEDSFGVSLDDLDERAITDTADVLELTRATSTPMGGRPELVIHARSARSVLDRYSWDERSAGRLASGGGSVVATRAVVNESEATLTGRPGMRP